MTAADNAIMTQICALARVDKSDPALCCVPAKGHAAHCFFYGISAFKAASGRETWR